MIELSWFQIASPQFQTACQQIWDCPRLDAKTSYSAHRIKTALDKVNEEVTKLRHHLIQKHGKKDENGQLIHDSEGRITFDDPIEGMRAFEEEFLKEFNNRKVELKINKLNFQDLNEAQGISPRAWEQLKPIIDNLPEQDETEDI